MMLEGIASITIDYLQVTGFESIHKLLNAPQAAQITLHRIHLRVRLAQQF